jgi:Ca-activated chloride channel family protein
MPVDVDEKTLQKIAEMTNGQYFRATNNRTLKQIYAEIDKLEKTRIEVKAYRSHTELFYDWVGLGVMALLLEVGLTSTVLRKLP